MPGRSIVNQGALIQKEVTPGTPLVNAMKRVAGLRVMPGFNDEGENFTASGSKVPTSYIYNSELGDHAVETLQDYNAATWTFCGGFGQPTTTTPSGGTLSRQHDYALNPSGADTLQTFTVMWGDSTQALQLPHFTFTSLSLGIGRNDISLDSAAMSYEPITGITYPSTGITEVASQPAAGRQWNAYLDTTWAGLGTTKLTTLYGVDIEFPDKYSPDWVVNRSLTSFDSLMESEDFEPTIEARLGFDATSVGLITGLTAGTVRFLRLESQGPLIEGTIYYGIRLDMAIRITSRGQIDTNPSGSIALPFSGHITRDTTSGNSAQARITNVVTGL